MAFITLVGRWLSSGGITTIKPTGDTQSARAIRIVGIPCLSRLAYMNSAQFSSAETASLPQPFDAVGIVRAATFISPACTLVACRLHFEFQLAVRYHDIVCVSPALLSCPVVVTTAVFDLEP